MRILISLLSVLLFSCGKGFQSVSHQEFPDQSIIFDTNRTDLQTAYNNFDSVSATNYSNLSETKWRVLGHTTPFMPTTGVKPYDRLVTIREQISLVFERIQFNESTMQLQSSCSTNNFVVDFALAADGSYQKMYYDQNGEINMCGLSEITGFFEDALGREVQAFVWEDYLYIKKIDSQLWILKKL